jgi:hypothetical protein
MFYISRLVVELMVLTSSSSLYTDDVLGMLLNIEENKVAFYLNGEAIERDFPAKNRLVYELRKKLRCSQST